MKNKELHDKLDAFLSERRKSTGGWAKLTPEDVPDLQEIIHDIVKVKCEPAPDGDYPINFIVIDRTKFEPMHFTPVEYNHSTEKEKRQKILDRHLFNLSIAMKRVETAMRLLKLDD